MKLYLTLFKRLNNNHFVVRNENNCMYSLYFRENRLENLLTSCVKFYGTTALFKDDKILLEHVLVENAEAIERTILSKPEVQKFKQKYPELFL